jgi:hypothetical protein
MRGTLRARRWSQFDMHHLLWAPALGDRRRRRAKALAE